MISEADINAVVEVLRSDWLTQGPLVPRFEEALTHFCGRNLDAVVFNSATSALHAACRALDVGMGDLVWTVPNTFVASANCALYCGAEVDFVDIDPLSWTMCPKSLEEKLFQADRDNALPTVLIPVHFAGTSADMRSIFHLAKKYGIKIIEDASHALGCRYLGSYVGSCEYSDITVFSFHPVKMITTGEGGAALCKNTRLARRMQLFRSHGVTREATEFRTEASGPWSYQQIELGYNYRMTDLAAGLGITQLSRLDGFLVARRSLAQFYESNLSGLPLRYQKVSSEVDSSRHLFVIQLLEGLSDSGARRKKLFSYLRQKGIGVNVHYEPVHLQPHYTRLGFQIGDYPAAEAYAKSCISLPIFPDLRIEECDYICSVIRESVESL